MILLRRASAGLENIKDNSISILSELRSENGNAFKMLERCSDILKAFPFIRDLEGIQTPNPQSRNLMRYSVAPRGQCSHLRECKLTIILRLS